MPLLRRLTAVLSSVLLLQLSLQASGTLCAMHGAAVTGMDVAAMHAMAGSASPAAVAAPTPSRSAAAETPAMPHGCDGTSEGCGLPWAPGQCASMATCSATPASPAIAFAPASVARVASAIAEPRSFLSGPTAAPELPPPRA